MIESVFEPTIIGADEHPVSESTFPWQHAVVDLETMGGPPDGAIISIGFCYFDIRTGDIGPTYERNVDLDSSLGFGMKTDKSTIEWWSRAEQAAAFEHTKKDAVHLTQMLIELTDFLDENKRHPCLWGNGSSFDNVILARAFQLAGLKFQCHFRQWRDMRTWVREVGAGMLGMKKKAMEAQFGDGGFRPHVAIDDAIREAKIISVIWQEIKGRLS